MKFVATKHQGRTLFALRTPRGVEEDLADLATVRNRRDEPRRSLQSVVKELRRRDKL